MTTINQIKAELRDIINLSDKATPGPWHKECHDNSFENGYAVGGKKHVFIASRLVEDNASFIATSRNLTPKMAQALLTAIEGLEVYANIGGTVVLVGGDARNAIETIRREWEG